MDNCQAHKPDFDNTEQISHFVELFYSRLLQDQQLAPFFLEIAAIDITAHRRIIVSYWEKLLLGNKEYQRHTMDIHRRIHRQQVFTKQHFEHWLLHFESTLEHNFHGPYAQRAKRLANTIAANMFENFN